MKKVLLALASTVALASPAIAGDIEPRVGMINGFRVMAIENGHQGTDLLVVNGGLQDIAVNCNVTEDYATYGSLDGNTVYGIVESWCSW